MSSPIKALFAVLPVALIATAAWPAATAFAHISLEAADTHVSRYGDGEIKDAPCGRTGGARGTNVYTYAPGETITVTVVEFVPHPSYFRIAFDDDGDDGFVDPRSIAPLSRACLSDATDQCGEADFFNNDTVLMDNLDPHASNGTQTYSWQVTLPNVRCTNCTLQIIQVMEDAVHGPYNPSASGVSELFYIEDIYHTCIDLVLEGPVAGQAPTLPQAGAGAGAGTGGAAGMGATAGVGGSGTDLGMIAGAPAGGVAGSAVMPSAGVANGGVPSAGATGSTTTPVPGAAPSAGAAGAAAVAMPSMSNGSNASSAGCGVQPSARRDGATAWLLLLASAWLLRRRPARAQ